MRGIVRPCRQHLTPPLRERWRAHLCGSCLALRDTGGQAARVLTGYDLLLVPVLVEAQAGRLPTVRAGACALRGMRGADVIDPASPAARAGAATALAAGAAGLADKVADGDVPVALRRSALAAGRRLGEAATRAAAGAGTDVSQVSLAAARAAAVERRPGATLEQLLAPAGAAVAAAFAQTAGLAGRPGNAAALRDLGDAFGRLVHLLDAVDDRGADRRAGRYNPLDATGTGDELAAAEAQRLRASVRAGLDRLELVDGDLVRALLGPTLDAALRRRWPDRPAAPAAPSPERRRGAGALLVGVAAALRLSMWGGGGRWGGRGRRWGGGGYGDPYGPPPGYGYGYGRRGRGGPSCCDLLACDCCASEVCSGCCGGDGDCCVCCV